MLRSLAVVVGCAIVLTSAHISIMASGGYGGPTAPLQIAVSLGLCVGSVCVGSALGERRWLLAFVFVVTLLAGESYTILTTSEVTLSERDAVTARLVEQNAKRTAALEELAALETARPVSADSLRLQAAEKAQAAAEAVVRDKAADHGCRQNCRLLLQSAVDAAQREVAAARMEFDEKTRTESQKLRDRRTAAKAAAAALPPARSATPLADHLRVPEWVLDLLVAALRSIAANGLGAALIAFGAHANAVKSNRELAADPVTPCCGDADLQVDHISEPAENRAALTPPLPASTARDHAVRFSREMLRPADSNIPVSALHGAYLAWCQNNEQAPFNQREIGREMANLFKRVGIEILEMGGEKFVVCARLDQPDGQIA